MPELKRATSTAKYASNARVALLNSEVPAAQLHMGLHVSDPLARLEMDGDLYMYSCACACVCVCVLSTPRDK